MNWLEAIDLYCKLKCKTRLLIKLETLQNKID